MIAAGFVPAAAFYIGDWFNLATSSYVVLVVGFSAFVIVDAIWTQVKRVRGARGSPHHPS